MSSLQRNGQHLWRLLLLKVGEVQPAKNGNSAFVDNKKTIIKLDIFSINSAIFVISYEQYILCTVSVIWFIGSDCFKCILFSRYHRNHKLQKIKITEKKIFVSCFFSNFILYLYSVLYILYHNSYNAWTLNWIFVFILLL